MNAVRKIQRARSYIYKKVRQFTLSFYIQNPDTVQKTRQFTLRFYIQKA